MANFVTKEQFTTALSRIKSWIVSALSGKQDTLVSGTNIKTVNGISLLDAGDVDTENIFIATYGATSVQAIRAALAAGKKVFCATTEAQIYSETRVSIQYDKKDDREAFASIIPLTSSLDEDGELIYSFAGIVSNQLPYIDDFEQPLKPNLYRLRLDCYNNGINTSYWKASLLRCAETPFVVTYGQTAIQAINNAFASGQPVVMKGGAFTSVNGIEYYWGSLEDALNSYIPLKEIDFLSQSDSGAEFEGFAWGYSDADMTPRLYRLSAKVWQGTWSKSVTPAVPEPEVATQNEIDSLFAPPTPPSPAGSSSEGGVRLH